MKPYSLFYLLYSRSAGQSLVEIIVALGVFALVIGSAFVTFWGGQVISIDDVNAQMALDYGQEGLDAVKSIRDQDWTKLTDGNHGLEFISGKWQFASTTGDSRDIFSRVVSISSPDTNTKIATTTVSWQTDPLRPLNVTMVEQLTDWQSPLIGGCSSDPISGNWHSPRVIGSADLGAGISGTDVVVKLPYVFMSGTASTASKNDVFVFDVSNPAAPALLRAINIGSGGISALYLKDNYLYAASTNDNKELIIFNISDPANMSEVGSLDLAGSADALGIVKFGNTVAIGRDSSAANELAFVNVSNPASPTIISQSATNGSIKDLYATSEKLYLVSQESDPDVWIYDITNPASPTFISNYDIPGETEDTSIYIQDKNGINILVGNEQNELITIGATTTSQLYVRDRINLGGVVNDITCVKGDLAFLSTSNSNKEFVIVDVSNPDNITEYANLNFPQVASGIDYAQNKVFVAMRSNDSLKIITSSP